MNGSLLDSYRELKRLVDVVCNYKTSIEEYEQSKKILKAQCEYINKLEATKKNRAVNSKRRW